MNHCRPVASFALLLLALAGSSSTQTAAPTPPEKHDYSKEGFVIEQLSTTATFENDGRSTRTVQARVRMNSEAGVQRFGLLKFAYQGSTETLDFDDIRVRKNDGTVVQTPPENVQDQPSEVSQIAPLYSDLREKHIAVKGLGSGDTLEYLCRWKVNNPLAPGQFWYDYNFEDDVVVLDEQLEVRVPKARPVRLTSPSFAPRVSESGNYTVYTWKHSNLQPKSEASDDAKRDRIWQLARGRLEQPNVRLSSFQSWAEVGRWYGDLQKDRVKPDPVIQAKAAELTKNATDDLEKMRALYHYVSTQFRYIGIDFGIGRYQPHKAAEVLANQYGDCKDKHTLLAGLLGAVGIKAEPALVSSTHELDLDVPSPSQFDHVITYVPLASGPVWLDSTLEVAPFAHLVSSIREKHALVIPENEEPSLEMTPANPPYPESLHFALTGKLGDDGVLDAQVERVARGDSELLLRAGFRRMPQSQWKDLVQAISYATGFGGSVSDVVVSSPEDTEHPIKISYKYNRKDYSDWKDKQITPPLPVSFLFSYKDDTRKPTNPIWLGAPGELVMEAKIELPKGYVAKTPPPVDLEKEFAEYHSKCKVKDGVMVAERRLVIKRQEVSPTQFEAYKSLQKAVSDDEDNYTTFTAENGTKSGGKQAEQSLSSLQDEFWKLPNSSNADAERLEEQARLAWHQRNLPDALSMLQQAVAADPRFARAWVSIAELSFWNGHQSEALDAYRKAVAAEPKQAYPYKALGIALMGMRKPEEASAVWRDLEKNVPDDRDAPLYLGQALLSAKQYADALVELEKAEKQNPNRAGLQMSLGTAYLHSKESEKAKAAYAKAIELAPGYTMLNDAAYSMAEANGALDQALRYAQQAVEQAEENSRKIDLSALKNEDLQSASQLSAFWDTLGWVYFRQGDLLRAEKALLASWRVSLHSAIADHLGQVYEKEQKKAAAIHMYQLSLAATPAFMSVGETDTVKRLKRLGGTVTLRGPVYGGGEELSKLRTVKLPRIVQGEASAEYFILFGPGLTVQETKFISGSDNLKSARQRSKPASLMSRFQRAVKGESCDAEF